MPGNRPFGGPLPPGQSLVRNGLRRTNPALGGCIALAVAAAAPVPAHADRDGFYIRNQAETSVTAVYVSPIFSKRWRDDRLPETVAPGSERWVPVETLGDNDCFYDIRVEDSLGQPYEFWSVDLCTTRIVTVP